MTMNESADILNTLTPHIEKRAMWYAVWKFVMPSRMLVARDMTGLNVRKISKYLESHGAVALSEGVVIPDREILRARLAEIIPTEWGDSYPVTEQRISTDLENVVADIITALSESSGKRREKLAFKRLLALATSANTYSQTANDYSMSYQIPLQAEFAHKGNMTQLFHVVHPYQVIPVRQTLTDLTKAAVPDFRNRLIAQWDVGGFGNLNVVEGTYLPRKLVYKLAVTASSGTFKLDAGELDTGVRAVTGNITVSATPATMVSNIKTALDTATGVAWTVSGAAIDNITITAPYAVDREDELKIPYVVTAGVRGLDASLTGGTVTIQEKSATALAPMFIREALIDDQRKPFTLVAGAYDVANQKKRTIENFFHEMYGIGAWEENAVLFVETKANSPFAVG